MTKNLTRWDDLMLYIIHEHHEKLYNEHTEK